MERTTQKLIDYEAMDSVKSVVEKVRPAVESALLKAYDAAGRKIERLEADIEHRKQAAKEKVAGYRDALRDSKADTRIMEQEFLRIVRVYEQMHEEAGRRMCRLRI